MKKAILILLLILPIYLFINVDISAQENYAVYKKKYDGIQNEYDINNNVTTTNISFDINFNTDNNDCILLDISANIPIIAFDARMLDYVLYIEYEYNNTTNSILIDKNNYSAAIISSRLYESESINIIYRDERIKILFNMPINRISITQMKYNSVGEPPTKLDENYLYIVDEYFLGLITHREDNLRPYDDIKPVIIMDDIYTSIDSPILPSAIKLMAKATDNISGDISNRIFISDTNYTVKDIGDFYIVLTVYDDYDNRCDKLINVYVRDMTPPSISGNDYYEVGIINRANVLDIYNNLMINDNISEEFEVIIDDNYTANSTKLGEYKVIYRIFDEAKNESRFEVTIKANDDVSPAIIGDDINTYISNPIDINEIINSFTYTDNITNNDNLIVTYDTNYDIRNVGTYYFKLMVKDEFNNIGKKEIKINIIDDEKPFFIVDEKIVTKLLNHDELLRYFNIN